MNGFEDGQKENNTEKKTKTEDGIECDCHQFTKLNQEMDFFKHPCGAPSEDLRAEILSGRLRVAAIEEERKNQKAKANAR